MGGSCRFRSALVWLLATIVTTVSLPARASAVALPRWDPRVKPIAEAVEHLRGLKFKHPVTVDLLSDSAFAERFGATRPFSKAEEAYLFRDAAQWRALGLISGDVDLAKSLRAIKAGVPGFYDSRRQRVEIRSKHLDPFTKVRLSHELTHVLQDQHFDLLKLQTQVARNHWAPGALLAVVEGDAERIRMRYLAGLS